MNYDTMTIESLANECFERSGYKINKADLESRIKHLCEKYHQDKLKNESLHVVMRCPHCLSMDTEESITKKFKGFCQDCDKFF
tara:strand:- start:59 stop:307 length:249 start_codon:yes stop_codon:yes gene_type:complete